MIVLTEKLHVLQVVGAMNIGGIENMLMTLMPQMLERGIIFDFAVHGNAIGVHEKRIKELGGKVYHMPKFVGINVFTYLRVWKKLLSSHPELRIIHGHMTSTASLYLWVAKRYGRVIIAHSHSTSTSGGKLIYWIKRMMEYPLRYLCDYLCACSAAAADYRFGHGASKRSNYFLWHNAIDTEKFKFSRMERSKYRKRLDIDNNTIVIGHVGRMIPAKNHMFLIKIFCEYHKINPTSKLLLVGDGPLRDAIEEKVNELKLYNATIFTGNVENTAEYLSAMDVFCFPSIYEGLSVSLIEAQINGRICLGSDVIPHEVSISDNLKFLSLSEPAIIWAEEIARLLKNAVEPRKKYNFYDVNIVSEEIRKFYTKIYAEA